MAILVSDTATEVLAVGIGQADTGRVDFSATAVVPRAHSRWLQPTLAHGLKVCGVAPGSIKAIGVGVGPGSYTGVRLAVSTAKAMALAVGAVLYPIPTLLTLAEAACSLRDKGTSSGRWSAGETGREVVVVPLLNARRRRAFGSVYRWTASGWRQELPIQVQSLDEWSKVLNDPVQGGSTGTFAAIDILVVHDFAEDADVPAWMGGGYRVNNANGAKREIEPPIVVHRLQDLGNLIPAAMLRLISKGNISGVVGEDIHAVVPEYALLVEAESKLAEGKSLAGDVH